MKLKKKGFTQTLKKATAGVLAASMMLTPINVMAAEVAEMFETTRAVALERALDLMEMFDVPGVTMSLVDADSGYTWTQGLGYADAVQGTAVTEDTLFSIGSTAKTFTAVAIMQLVEAGLLDLDEPIITYLPEFSMLPNPIYGGDYRNITARMLLNHTSGIHELLNEQYIDFNGGGQDRERMNNLFSLMPNLHMKNQELNNETYNNTGYALLGILVARLMGAENYYDGFVDFTQENIFYPSGMTSSSFEITAENRPNIALPHLDAETAAEDFYYVHTTSGGGMVSNAVDMARFMHIMLNGGRYGSDEDTRILNSASIDEMIAVENLDFEQGISMGLGLMYRRHASGAVSMGHAGGLQHHTDMFLDFENGIGVFVSVNSTSGAALPNLLGEAIWKAAVYEKNGIPVSLNPYLLYNSDPFIPESLEELEGWYTLAGQLVLNDEGVLVFPSFQGSPMDIELTPIGDGFFEPSVSGMDFPAELPNFSFRQENGTMFLFAGATRQGERLEPTPAPESFERWTGRWGTIDEEGNEKLAFTLGIDENGFAHSMRRGVLPFLEEVVDDYTIVTLGRSRLHGGVRTFSIEDGVPTISYSGEEFVKLEPV